MITFKIVVWTKKPRKNQIKRKDIELCSNRMNFLFFNFPLAFGSVNGNVPLRWVDDGSAVTAVSVKHFFFFFFLLLFSNTTCDGRQWNKHWQWISISIREIDYSKKISIFTCEKAAKCFGRVHNFDRSYWYFSLATPNCITFIQCVRSLSATNSIEKRVCESQHQRHNV